MQTLFEPDGAPLQGVQHPVRPHRRGCMLPGPSSILISLGEVRAATHASIFGPSDNDLSANEAAQNYHSKVMRKDVGRVWDGFVQIWGRYDAQNQVHIVLQVYQ